MKTTDFPFAELQVASNFSFLRGASHPEELVQRAAALGYQAIALTDLHSLAGIVRAHKIAKECEITFLVGTKVEIETDHGFPLSLLLYPTSLASYQRLSRLLTTGKMRSDNNGCILELDDFFSLAQDLITIISPPIFDPLLVESLSQNEQYFLALCKKVKTHVPNSSLLYMGFTKNYSHNNFRHIEAVIQIAEHLHIDLVATNDVHYHLPERKPLGDVLTCIREKKTIQTAGYLLQANAERYLKSPKEIYRLYSDTPKGLSQRALANSVAIAKMASGFSLDLLRYEYPREICPDKRSPLDYLSSLTWIGAKERYPEGVPNKVKRLIQDELKLIHELGYEKYFLTCYDIVCFARGKGILCQGRGAAANSAVCYCLGITSVNPDQIDILFARFVSKERAEPPDIDIDFEHERREEVIQYIYEKYGRERAALTCEVVTYRHRSAIREVGKALGITPQIIDSIAKSLHRWTGNKLPAADLKELGVNPEDPLIQNCLAISNQLLSFPRHLSQHVGGFIISEKPLCEVVPIRPARMEDRTIIEWDKDDIEVLGMLKIDILALGMLSCIRKALAAINQKRTAQKLPCYELYSIPREDPKVYDMVCNSDTVGVFQIESRAQMSMLPRLRPRCFYDLVIEVAIVRPGPILGNMVHPFLRRRNGAEKAEYPDKEVERVLGKTLGVPIFQEQAMRLSIVLAGFTPGEAEKLRRAMAAWKKNKGAIAEFKERIMKGMQAKGYSTAFAENCVEQLKGFSEYGFPESHAASFALLVYASAWIKHYYPAEFASALINSQPMGFYAPAQIISDAEKHGVKVFDVDINHSDWDCRVDDQSIRLGMRLVKGISKEQVELITQTRALVGKFTSVSELWTKARKDGLRLRLKTLHLLAKANAFQSLGLTRRETLWEIRALPKEPLPFDFFSQSTNSFQQVSLPFMSEEQNMFHDYATKGLSLTGHPIGYIRELLNRRNVQSNQTLKNIPPTQKNLHVFAAGICLFRQRPGTANGVMFVTLEDETGVCNLIVPPKVFEKYSKTIISSSALMAYGKLEKIGHLPYILVRRLESLDEDLRALVG